MKCAVAFILLSTVVLATYSLQVPEGLKTINPFAWVLAEEANYFFDAKPVEVDLSAWYMSVVVNSVESSVGYLGLDFGDGGATSVSVRAGAAYLDGQRVMVNFHLDSPTRKPFATVEVLNTGSWTTYVDYHTNISAPPTGVHDMYVTFASVDALDTICYFDGFHFYA